MSCTVTAPGGANTGCINFLGEANYAIVTDPSFKWSDVGAVDNIEQLRVLLQETRKGFIVALNGSEPTLPEANIETSGFGNNYITSENSPSLIGYADMSACDFKEILASWKGGSYRVALFLSDGSIMVHDKGPEQEGFLAQVFAHAFGAPGRENQQQMYKITFNFLIGEEFDNYSVVPVNFSGRDVIELLPIGLTATVNTAFDGTQVILNVFTRCVPDDLKSGVMTGEIVKSTQGVVVTAVPTDNADGTYTVVVQKTGAVDLAAGEYAEFILVVRDGFIYEEITNKIKVVG